MHKRLRILSLILSLILVLCTYGCGSGTAGGNSPEADELCIGVLVPDSGNASSMTYYHLDGIKAAVEKLGLPEKQFIPKYSVTDVSFDKDAKLSAKEYVPEETKDTQEPESYTEADGKVVEIPAPLPTVHETAVQAMEDLLFQGCNVLIAVDPMYDAFTSYAASALPDVKFIQYNGTDNEKENLQSYTDKTEEGFYMAGALGATAGGRNFGFVAGVNNDRNRDFINAFALGAAAFVPECKVTAGFTNADVDLILEQTVPAELIDNHNCDFIAQSVLTALPQTVAANASQEYAHEPLPCIGFSFDMHTDGGDGNLCSILFDYSVYFTPVLQSIQDGTFTNTPYEGGIQEGLVVFSELYTKDETVKTAMDELLSSFRESDFDVFEGFQAEESGFASNVTIN